MSNQNIFGLLLTVHIHRLLLYLTGFVFVHNVSPTINLSLTDKSTYLCEKNTFYIKRLVTRVSKVSAVWCLTSNVQWVYLPSNTDTR